ncbi:hypothetical protein SNE35_25025, partial [Paucibacter sp. R3-3]
ILLLLKSEADCLADQRWQEWRIEFGPMPPEQLPRERFSPLADTGGQRDAASTRGQSTSGNQS